MTKIPSDGRRGFNSALPSTAKERRIGADCGLNISAWMELTQLFRPGTHPRQGADARSRLNPHAFNWLQSRISLDPAPRDWYIGADRLPR